MGTMRPEPRATPPPRPPRAPRRGPSAAWGDAPPRTIHHRQASTSSISPASRASSGDFVLHTPESFDGSCMHDPMPLHMHDRAARPDGKRSHTHSRSLSRRLPFPLDNSAQAGASIANFSMGIHPALRDDAPRAGSALRRTRSSAGRPERTPDPQPPLPHRPILGSQRRPSPKAAAPGPSVPVSPPTPFLEADNELAITCAAEVAVRRRVRSAPKSPTLPSYEKHRRSTSLGGDQAFAPPTRRPTPRIMSHAPPYVQPKLRSPMPFAIPRRAPPPPPILVPLTAKRMRSPPKTSPNLPAPMPPSRSLPLPPGPPPNTALPPLPLELAPFAPLHFDFEPPMPPPFSPESLKTPSPRSPALGPDSAYARFRARTRARANTLASLPSVRSSPSAAETRAETIAAIREAELWDWPIPPLVRRPPHEPERVEELRRVRSHEPYMHPFAAARHDPAYAPVRRGSTASLAAQHSGSSSEGPRTPDECPSPQFTLVRGPAGLVIKSVAERPVRRYGTPF